MSFDDMLKLAPLLRNAASHEDPARVVNISSIGGLRMPRFGNFSYGPSKAAVIHMTRQMGVHLMSHTHDTPNGRSPDERQYYS
jgi:NAD(P)-dependent dehydrogenase (short-subunit alcohol dehydrogenase family)